jgi:iron complex transport system substrate-binding protein
MTRRLAFVLAVLLLAITGCGPAAAPAPAASTTATAVASPAFPATVTDFQGRAVIVPSQPQRVVSIGPSNTEFLFALGAGERVVGADDFSDEPAAAKKLEKIGGVKVNVEKVVSLRPDLVISVKFSDGTIERIAGAGIPVLVVDPQVLGDVARTALLIGRAVGRDGDGLARSIDQKLEALKQRTAGATTQPRVFHEVDASDPSKPFTVGLPLSFVWFSTQARRYRVPRCQLAYCSVSPKPLTSPTVLMTLRRSTSPEAVST